MKMIKHTLDDCPFCKCEVHIETRDTNDVTYYSVLCPCCGLQTEEILAKDKKDIANIVATLIMYWNMGINKIISKHTKVEKDETNNQQVSKNKLKSLIKRIIKGR